MSRESTAVGSALGCRIFLVRLNIRGALFDCTLESKRLHIQYPRRDNLSNSAHLQGIISSILD
jgi:hypothetical protein